MRPVVPWALTGPLAARGVPQPADAVRRDRLASRRKNMSTKMRTWSVRRVDRRVIRHTDDCIEPQTINTPVGTVEAMTREEAVAAAKLQFPGVEINVTRGSHLNK